MTALTSEIRREAPPQPPPGVCVRCRGPVDPEFFPGGRVIAAKWIIPDLCANCLEKSRQKAERAERAERKFSLLSDCNLPGEAFDWNFDRAEAQAREIKASPADLEAWQRAHHACRYWPGGRRGLYLYGEAGTGKTVLAWCLLTWALTKEEPLSGFFLPVSELFDEIGLSFGADSRARYLAGRAKEARLLVLDDIGAVRPRRKMAEVLFEIVDTRTRAHRPTVYTSNYGPGDLDRRLRDQFGRVIDRIVGSTEGVPVMGRSFRILEAENQWRR